MRKLLSYLSLILLPVLVTQAQDQSPVVSFLLNKKQYSTDRPDPGWDKRITVQLKEGILRFTNISSDTLLLSNPVPFGIGGDHVYITGLGNNSLSRTHLFLPGRAPVNVIVPDNAWDMGYCSVPVESGASGGGGGYLTALIRRDRRSLVKGRVSRFETTLYPGGSIQYKW